MKTSYSTRLKKKTYEIFTGDYYSTNEKNVVMTTLLGSCISVCLWDRRNSVVGMNHFMLPGSLKSKEIVKDEDARYGIHAMDLLINSMMKKGASRVNLESKVFGGGQVIRSEMTTVAQSNIDFITSYLDIERIPVRACDVGGNSGRKLFLFSDTFEVYMKRVSYNKTLRNAVDRERSFYNWLQKQRKDDERVTLFD